MDDPADARCDGRLKQRLGVTDGVVEGDTFAGIANPVGVVEDARPFHRPAQSLRVGEVQRMRFQSARQGVCAVGVSGQRTYPEAIVQQTPGDVPAGVTEGAGHDGLVGVGQHLQFPFRSVKLVSSF